MHLQDTLHLHYTVHITHYSGKFHISDNEIIPDIAAYQHISLFLFFYPNISEIISLILVLIFMFFFYVLFFKPSQINRPAVKAWQEYFSQIHIYLSISWRKKSFSNIPLIQQIFKFLHFYSTFQTLNNSSSHLNSLFQSNFPSEFLREFPDSDLYFCHSDSVFDGWSP